MTIPPLARYPLEGIHLIDASAGTGKTFTISGLFVRLLLERGLTVRQILVVTYTKAATEDLRVRVRQMILSCLDAFSRGEAEDPFVRALLAGTGDHRRAAGRLASALHNFDEAAIFTIHGFCQRMLRENTLESGALFDTELVPDLDELWYEVAADFWRRQINRFPASFLSANRERLHPDRLFSFLKKVRPGQVLLPEMEADWLENLLESGGLDELDQRLEDALAELFALWARVREEVGELFGGTSALKKTSYKPEARRLWLLEMDEFCLLGDPRAEPFAAFAKFASENLACATKKNCSTPDHRLFDLCQAICDLSEERKVLHERCIMALFKELARYGQEESERRKRRRNVFAYDDLLVKLLEALSGGQGERLAGLIAEKFPAALIDEFQDTDPVQYEIFTRIYREGGPRLLYIIGDPKQAIYSFRGADVFSYLQAIRDVPSHFTLANNYRSAPDLIRAVNSVFAGCADPFVFQDIAFEPVSPAEKKERDELVCADGAAPLQILQVLRRPEEAKPLTKPVAEERILAVLAGKISGLLRQGRQGAARIGSRPLAPRDIAVLVRENREARLVQKALAAAGVAAVLQGSEDLFVSAEAEELLLVLGALADPADERKMRSALATDMLGGTCTRLFALSEDEGLWEPWYASFYRYRQTWQARGFMAMFRLLLREEEVRSRLLSLEEGERRITNVLHLGEVLHRYEAEEKASMAGLLDYLAERRASREQPVEEHQLRLESDEERVQIITIHRAKGLQYPLVFCPFSWGGLRRKGGEVAFHLRGGERQPALDLGSEELERHKQLADEEEMAENLRLLYVALTRAVHRLYLFWGPFNGAESSALAWLLHRDQGSSSLRQSYFKTLSDGEIRAELEPLLERADRTIEVVVVEEALASSIPEEDGEKEILDCPVFAGRITADWQLTSFSALAATLGHGGEGGGDALPADEPSIFSFPRGAGPGTFLHAIFEELDFPLILDEPGACRRLIAGKCAQYGYGEKWHDALFGMVERVLAAPLPGRDGPVTLSSVTRDQRLTELEFHLPLAGTRAPDLKNILEEELSAEVAESLGFSVGKGFLKGFIDLVFVHGGRYYLLDWKSNYLGPACGDYDPTRLARVMVQEKYTLQALLYTVALHHYLAWRIAGYDYEHHFGGVFYLFLRGVNPAVDPAGGIHHDRPAPSLIRKLSRELVRQP